MEMEFSRKERVVGAFVIIVSLLLMATLVVIGRGKEWFATHVTYHTTFNESYNLQKNAAVKLFKTDIGKVKDITLQNDRVLVRLAIQEKYASRIRQDAIAVVESPTFIGSEYLSIIPGSSESPQIPEQGEIPSREKRSLEDFLTEFEVEKTAKMVVAVIQEFAMFAETFGDPKGPLYTALNNIEKTSQDAALIVAELRAGKGPLGTILRSEKLLKQIVGNLERMGAILENIDIAAAKAPAAMEQVRKVLDDLYASTGDLKVIVDNIKAGSHKVPEITTTFQDGIDEIREGVEQIDRIVQSLRESFLIRANLPAEPVLESTDAQARP